MAVIDIVTGISTNVICRPEAIVNDYPKYLRDWRRHPLSTTAA